MSKILLNALAVVGVAVIVLQFLGAVGLGDFMIYYGGDAHVWCRQVGGK
ncbi:hypothetical protein K5M36_17020 [Chromobacterium vaccinii]|nr:hypothetical protein [Chromobacterium vaccinii]